MKKREIIYFKFIRVSDAEILILFIYFFLMNIYLGNLNYGVKEQDLQTLLEGFGAIDSVKIIVDRESGRSKGFLALQEMSDDEAPNGRSKNCLVRNLPVVHWSLKKLVRELKFHKTLCI